MSTEQMREAFEVWAISKSPMMSADLAWQAWQAATEAAALLKEPSKHNYDDGVNAWTDDQGETHIARDCPRFDPKTGMTVMPKEPSEVPLPKPRLEDIEYEIWGQNVRDDFYTADQMRTYAAECVRQALKEQK